MSAGLYETSLVNAHVKIDIVFTRLLGIFLNQSCYNHESKIEKV